MWRLYPPPLHWRMYQYSQGETFVIVLERCFLLLSRFATLAGLRTPPRSRVQNRRILSGISVKVTSVTPSDLAGSYSGIQSAQVEKKALLTFCNLLCDYPGVNDESMLMWIIYSCEGGTDETKTEIPTCETDKTRCDQNYSCTQDKTCSNSGGFCK